MSTPLSYSDVMKRKIDIRPTNTEINCSATKKIRKQEQSATSKTTTTKNVIPSERNTTSILDFITVRHKKNARCQPYPNSNPSAVPDSNPSAVRPLVHVPDSNPRSNVRRQRAVVPVTKTSTAHNITPSSLIAKKLRQLRQLRPCRKQHVSTTNQSLEYRCNEQIYCECCQWVQ